MANVGLSGDPDGGLIPGLTMIAGPSKHFKSMFALMMAGAYMKKHPDAILLFYDNEFGTPDSYFKFFNIDTKRVYHSPLLDIEQLKHDLVTQLTELDKKDEVVIVIDSVGNLASKKEIDDAIKGSDKADMTRAKQFKSLWRMVTPHLTTKDIPLIAINHTYKTIEMFSKDQVSGGTGGIYSSNTIWIVGRQQNKKTPAEGLRGYNFIIRVEKSRYVKEGSKIPITVLFDGGILKYSGLFEFCKETGYINMPSRGWYEGIDPATGEVITSKEREDTINSDDSFWDIMFKRTDLKDFIKKSYAYGTGNADELFKDTNIADVDEEEEVE